MLITCWFSVYSVRSLFSFSCTFVKRFSGLQEIFVLNSISLTHVSHLIDGPRWEKISDSMLLPKNI